MVIMPPVTREPDPASPPASLEAARRQRQDRQLAAPATSGQPYVAAADVAALLNRIGECVRALPSFGRTRTQSSAVLAKRTLSAISTCSPSRLAEGDALRPVLERLNASRDALRGTAATGAERIAIARWIGQVDLPDGPTDDDGHDSIEERIDDLARAGALIAAEIDRLQQLDERRYA
jgi:hypothetical protein